MVYTFEHCGTTDDKFWGDKSEESIIHHFELRNALKQLWKA